MDSELRQHRRHAWIRRSLPRLPALPCVVCARWYWRHRSTAATTFDFCSRECEDRDLEAFGRWLALFRKG